MQPLMTHRLVTKKGKILFLKFFEYSTVRIFESNIRFLKNVTVNSKFVEYSKPSNIRRFFHFVAKKIRRIFEAIEYSTNFEHMKDGRIFDDYIRRIFEYKNLPKKFIFDHIRRNVVEYQKTNILRIIRRIYLIVAWGISLNGTGSFRP